MKQPRITSNKLLNYLASCLQPVVNWCSRPLTWGVQWGEHPVRSQKKHLSNTEVSKRWTKELLLDWISWMFGSLVIGPWLKHIFVLFSSFHSSPSMFIEIWVYLVIFIRTPSQSCLAGCQSDVHVPSVLDTEALDADALSPGQTAIAATSLFCIGGSVIAATEIDTAALECYLFIYLAFSIFLQRAE